MKIVWELGQGTSRAISMRSLWSGTTGLSTTVKTMLSNLVVKGLLQTTLDGNKFIYSPTKPAIKTLTKAADELMDRSVDAGQGTASLLYDPEGQSDAGGDR